MDVVEEAKTRARLRAERWKAEGEPLPFHSVVSTGAFPAVERERGRIDSNLDRCRAIIEGLTALPPQPATLRGRLGALLSKAVRRALFWYLPQLQDLHRLQADTQRRLLDMVIEARFAAAENAGSIGRLERSAESRPPQRR